MRLSLVFVNPCSSTNQYVRSAKSLDLIRRRVYVPYDLSADGAFCKDHFDDLFVNSCLLLRDVTASPRYRSKNNYVIVSLIDNNFLYHGVIDTYSRQPSRQGVLQKPGSDASKKSELLITSRSSGSSYRSVELRSIVSLVGKYQEDRGHPGRFVTVFVQTTDSRCARGKGTRGRERARAR